VCFMAIIDHIEQVSENEFSRNLHCQNSGKCGALKNTPLQNTSSI
jgi:hypothetical protein